MIEPPLAKLVPAQMRARLHERRLWAWLLFGTVFWGIPVGVLWSLVMTPVFVLGMGKPLDGVVMLSVACFPLWLVGGAAWGFIVRRQLLRRVAEQSQNGDA